MVLGYLLHNVGDDVCGGEISEQTGIRSGSLYPILHGLEVAGWVESEWESPDVGVRHGRPPRRYYRLTGTGETNAREYCAPDPVEPLERLRGSHEHPPAAANGG